MGTMRVLMRRSLASLFGQSARLLFQLLRGGPDGLFAQLTRRLAEFVAMGTVPMATAITQIGRAHV